MPPSQGIGKNDRTPVRTDGDEQFVFVTHDVEIVVFGERHADDEDHVVAVVFDPERSPLGEFLL